MALLVASLVCFLVYVFLEVPLLAVIPVTRMVIPAFAHTLLVCFVFRIILLSVAPALLAGSVIRIILGWSWGDGAAKACSVPPPIPAASARTQTQCFKFILINSHPFVFRLETRILRFVLATIAPNFPPKRTHGYFGKGTPMAGQRDAARVAPAKRTPRRRQSEEAVRPTTSGLPNNKSRLCELARDVRPESRVQNPPQRVQFLLRQPSSQILA